MWCIDNIKEFMNDEAEWHAFCEGFLEPFTWFWYKPMTLEVHEEIQKEHHYYRLGKAVSATAIVSIITAIILWRKRK